MASSDALSDLPFTNVALNPGRVSARTRRHTQNMHGRRHFLIPHQTSALRFLRLFKKGRHAGEQTEQRQDDL